MENKIINPVYELPANEYNKKLAEILKAMPEFEAPEWSFFVKTGISKDRPSQEKDFWFKRAASILRQIYIHKVVGVNRLRTRYGSKKNRGMKPERFKKSSGKIIRVILQQAETAELLEKHNIPGKRAGRKITDKGKELLESVGINEKPTKKLITPKKERETTDIQSDKIQEDNKINNEEKKE